MTRLILNSPNRNRQDTWTAEQLQEGAKLAALLASGQDPTGKYSPDSCNQWFRVKDQLLVPTPEKPQASGVGIQVPMQTLSR